MWRCVQGCFIASLLQYSRQHMTGTALSICAGDVYTFKFFMWIAERFAKCYGIMQIFFVCNCAYAAKHWQVSIKMINSFLVGHCSKYTAYQNMHCRALIANNLGE